MNLRPYLVILVTILILFSCKDAPIRPVIRIIPLPAQSADVDEIYTLESSTRIEINNESDQLRKIAKYLSNHIETYFGLSNDIIISDSKDKKAIFLKLDENLKIGKEDYHLNVQSNGILIEASSPNGLFYGVQTLIQLMPAVPKKLTAVNIPGVEINDTPRFAWRGLQLDVSRHFMPKDFMLKYLDEMALHKLNTLQWHLTDDQGWRVEIKKYPRLTEIGSVRNKTIIGHINNSYSSDTLSVGGYYTQNDIRDIVAYAKERYITIVPEIAMPGHALAALAAYPELGCTASNYEVASRWGQLSDVFCPGKETTFSFIKEVVQEMAPLFPGKYFHVGGAECPETRWEKCSQCQQRVESDSLETSHSLHGYFSKRVSDIVHATGKETAEWDDVLQDSAVSKGVIITWHGEDGIIKATKRNNQTVVSPGRFYNFDQYQNNPKEEPLAVGGLITLEQVYNFEPIPKDLSVRDSRNIIGVQANLWTPYMKTPMVVEYMTFPRAAALAEVGWSPKESRNYLWFMKRMQFQVKRYEAEKITYSKAEFKVAL